jgi:hypothetical protein
MLCLFICYVFLLSYIQCIFIICYLFFLVSRCLKAFLEKGQPDPLVCRPRGSAPVCSLSDLEDGRILMETLMVSSSEEREPPELQLQPEGKEVLEEEGVDEKEADPGESGVEEEEETQPQSEQEEQDTDNDAMSNDPLSPRPLAPDPPRPEGDPAITFFQTNFRIIFSQSSTPLQTPSPFSPPFTPKPAHTWLAVVFGLSLNYISVFFVGSLGFFII